MKCIHVVDNSTSSYVFHPVNEASIFFSSKSQCLILDPATKQQFVPCSSWFDDLDKRELLDLILVLEKLSKVDSV